MSMAYSPFGTSSVIHASSRTVGAALPFMQETAVTELFGFSEQLIGLNSESCSKTATLNHLRFQSLFLR